MSNRVDRPELNACHAQRSSGLFAGETLPMGGGKPFPEILADRKAYVVEFDGPSDRWNPKNWSSSSRLWISIIVCYGTFVATFDSAMFAPGATQASEEFAVGEEVGYLGTSLYVLGFAFGPSIWAPWSELMGRRWPLLVGMFGCSVFSIASATSKDIQTLIICRFFAGIFGPSPICVVPAVLSDIYDDFHRATAITIYALTVFVGPFAAPFVGGFTSASSLGWRWTLYLPAILGFFDVFLLLVGLRETYAPLILAGKAARIRRETGNWSIHAEQEKIEINMKEVGRKYLTRPIRMLATEPIVLLVSLYMSFIYGLVYGLFEAYPYVFEDIRGMAPGIAGLPFIALIIGQVLAVCFIILQQRHEHKKSIASETNPVPEAHLLPAIIGAFAFTAGFFWFAWTAFTATVHWMAPTASGVLVGFGILCIFLPCFNYLVNAYLVVTASTVAANIMLRSSIAAAFPLFSTQMFENLGVQWAGTLLGCLAAVMIPIPVLFRMYGPSLRRRSSFLSEPVASGEDVEKSDEAIC